MLIGRWLFRIQPLPNDFLYWRHSPTSLQR
jgi:hypothetical protein